MCEEVKERIRKTIESDAPEELKQKFIYYFENGLAINCEVCDDFNKCFGIKEDKENANKIKY